MLSAALEGELIYLYRRVRGAVGQTALAQGVYGVAQKQCARHEMEVNERLMVVFREMGDELQITAVVTCPLRC